VFTTVPILNGSITSTLTPLFFTAQLRGIQPIQDQRRFSSDPMDPTTEVAAVTSTFTATTHPATTRHRCNRLEPGLG